jgi:hypothetical protein
MNEPRNARQISTRMPDRELKLITVEPPFRIATLLLAVRAECTRASFPPREKSPRLAFLRDGGGKSEEGRFLPCGGSLTRAPRRSLRQVTAGVSSARCGESPRLAEAPISAARS